VIRLRGRSLQEGDRFQVGELRRGAFWRVCWASPIWFGETFVVVDYSEV
jgi:hypothetical protein